MRTIIGALVTALALSAAACSSEPATTTPSAAVENAVVVTAHDLARVAPEGSLVLARDGSSYRFDTSAGPIDYARVRVGSVVVDEMLERMPVEADRRETMRKEGFVLSTVTHRGASGVQPQLLRACYAEIWYATPHQWPSGGYSMAWDRILVEVDC